MALNRDSFITKLASLQSLLPFGKTLPPEAFVLAWESFPAQAKEELTDEAITWAMTKLLNDPEQHKELPIHLRLHRMLYSYANLSTTGLTIGPVPMGWRLKVDPHRLPPVDAPPPISEAALVAAGELPAHDGPRHAPAGVLAQLQATAGAVIDAHPHCQHQASRMVDELTIAGDQERERAMPWMAS